MPILAFLVQRSQKPHTLTPEAIRMDLRNDQITLGELWDNPKSRAVFAKRVPMLGKHPVKGAARSMTLAQLADFLSGWVPQPMINGVLQELRKL